MAETAEETKKADNENIADFAASVVGTEVESKAAMEQYEPADTSSIKQAVRWREQCYMAQALPDVLKIFGNFRKHHEYVTSFSSETDVSTADFTNRLHITKGDKDFVNISTFERGNLLWNINLYKVKYKDTNSDADITNYELDSEIPLIFEQMAKGDMENYKNNTQNKYHRTYDGQPAEKYKGRPQTGYGIKSFEWSLIGANPATVRNDIEAKLVIEFQNFNQLSKIRLADIWAPGDDRDKIKPRVEEYSLLDLLGYGPGSVKNESGEHAVYDPAFFEIKAVVGWDSNEGVESYEDPSNKTKGTKNKKLKDKIKGQKTTLFLTLIDHQFSISQLGTFTLILDYRARLESVASQMRSNVVFAVTAGAGDQDFYGKLLELDIESKKAACAGNEALHASLQAQRSEALKRAWLTSFQRMFDTEFSAIYLKDLKDDDFYGGISRLSQEKVPANFDANSQPLGRGAKQWRMYSLRVPALALREHFSGGEYVPGGVMVNALGGGSDDSVTSAAVAMATSLGKEAANEATDMPSIDPTGFYNRPINYAIKNTKLDGHDYLINFFRLGDLLNIMAHRALSAQHYTSSTGDDIVKGSFGTAKMIKIISGPVRFKIPAIAGKSGETEIRCSLSDLPITVENFADFWYRNVIQTKREVYSLMDFIRDLGDQIINKAFGAECAEGMGSRIAGHTRLKTNVFSLPMAPGGADPLLKLDADKYSSMTGDILVENLEEGDLLDPEALSITEPDNIYHYIVLYLENQESSLSGLTGHESEDAKRGIYHLKIHQGILQSIDFSKTDQPYLRETKFNLHNEDPLAHLSNVYNIRASLVGNTCFYPGDQVYIDPIGFGTSLGRPRDEGTISNVMGLGGYHTITSVTNKVSKDFTTEIAATWTSNFGTKPEDRKEACILEAKGKLPE